MLVAIPAGTGIATPSPATLGKWIAATPTMPLPRGDERASQDDTHVTQPTNLT